MTRKRPVPRPTEGELELLQALWDKGPSTVRELHEEISGRRPLGYTSVLKLLQIMTEKGLVKREESNRAHIYRAAATQGETRTQLLRDITRRLFAGSATQLAMHALAMEPVSDRELEELRNLIERKEETSMMDQWQALGWTLVHFLWQAAAIALLYRIADLLLTRSSATLRYALALAALVTMLGASLVTLAWEETGNRAGTQASEQALSFMVAGPPLPANIAQSATLPDSAAPQGNARRFQIDSALPWLDALWLAGILCLSLRALGGWWVLERLRRAALEEAPPVLRARLDVLRRQLGIRIGIRTGIDLRLSERITNPLTAGVLRPWILLPISALTSLSSEQLEMVLVHELAHIRRADYLWNLLQTAIETIFFFHPAVWWVSRRVREERELCCDDVALECCSDPAVYASALLRLEEERRSLRFAMALDGQSRTALRARIVHILKSPEGSPEPARFRPVSIAVLAAALVVFACPVPQVLASLHAAPKTADAPAAVVSQSGQPTPQPAPRTAKPSAAVPSDAETSYAGASNSESGSSGSGISESDNPESGNAETSARQTPAPAPKADAQTPEHSSYIDAMRAAGYDVDLDKYIAMKVQGITPEYAAAVAKEFGHAVPADQLIAMKVQDVTPEYMAQMRAAGYEANLSRYIAMKVQGITPEYAEEMAKAGFGKPDVDQLIALKVQNVTPDYAEKLRAAGIDIAGLEDLIADRIFAVTPEFVEQMKAAGYGAIPAKKLIALRVQGVTPEYAKSIRAQFPDATTDQLIQLRVFHIDPDFIASATRHGFAPLTIDRLVKLRISGILDDEHAKENR